MFEKYSKLLLNNIKIFKLCRTIVIKAILKDIENEPPIKKASPAKLACIQADL